MIDESPTQARQHFPGTDDELPGDWRDVHHETDHRYHWHRGDPYPSIRLSHCPTGYLAPNLEGWAVEIYPDPRNGMDGAWRTLHDTAEEGADRVLELMEEYPDE
jgi:hypothetical protein